MIYLVGEKYGFETGVRSLSPKMTGSVTLGGSLSQVHSHVDMHKDIYIYIFG